MTGTLVLQDGSRLAGTAFGARTPAAGEVVFNTGMVGYPECLTDPSYRGQILVLTYPLIGNYGVPADEPDLNGSRFFESQRMQITGLIVSELCANYSHWSGGRTLADWMTAQGIPGLSGIDTRALTQKLRSTGTMLGKIVSGETDIDLHDPNQDNLVAAVSSPEPTVHGEGGKRVTVIDCGCKRNILRCLLKRGVSVQVVPWNWPVERQDCDGVLISNGPGDPQQCHATIATVTRLMESGTPMFGICLGNQILALAAGAQTYKLKYGHRGQNQPCILAGTPRCFITSQNHGYAVDVDTLPEGWEPWFTNANDGTNEGIRHRRQPFRGVQFHPEATPGPTDTAYLFDEFVNSL